MKLLTENLENQFKPFATKLAISVCSSDLNPDKAVPVVNAVPKTEIPCPFTPNEAIRADFLF